LGRRLLPASLEAGNLVAVMAVTKISFVCSRPRNGLSVSSRLQLPCANASVGKHLLAHVAGSQHEF
jgi:hypothetical protein